MFLTPEQIADLADSNRLAHQVEWLTDHGFKFEISRAGRPKVLIQEVENRLLSNKKTSQKQRPTPRLDILDQVGAK